MNALSHWEQLYGFSPVWILSWVFKWLERLNFFNPPDQAPDPDFAAEYGRLVPAPLPIAWRDPRRHDDNEWGKIGAKRGTRCIMREIVQPFSMPGQQLVKERLRQHRWYTIPHGHHCDISQILASGKQIKRTLATIWKRATNILQCDNLTWDPQEHDCVVCRDGVGNWIPETPEEDKIDPLGDTRLYSILYRLSQLDWAHNQLSRSVFHFLQDLRTEEIDLGKEFSTEAKDIISKCSDDEEVLQQSFHQTSQPEKDTDTYFQLRYIRRLRTELERKDKILLEEISAIKAAYSARQSEEEQATDDIARRIASTGFSLAADSPPIQSLAKDIFTYVTRMVLSYPAMEQRNYGQTMINSVAKYICHRIRRMYLMHEHEPTLVKLRQTVKLSTPRRYQIPEDMFVSIQFLQYGADVGICDSTTRPLPFDTDIGRFNCPLWSVIEGQWVGQKCLGHKWDHGLFRRRTQHPNLGKLEMNEMQEYPLTTAQIKDSPQTESLSPGNRDSFMAMGRHPEVPSQVKEFYRGILNGVTALRGVLERRPSYSTVAGEVRDLLLKSAPPRSEMEDVPQLTRLGRLFDKRYNHLLKGLYTVIEECPMQTLISILNGATVLAEKIDLMELFESRMAMSVIIGETQPQQPAHTLAWPFLSPQRKSQYMLRTLRFTMDVLGITTRSQLAKHLQESKQPKSVSLYSPEKLLEVKTSPYPLFGRVKRAHNQLETKICTTRDSRTPQQFRIDQHLARLMSEDWIDAPTSVSGDPVAQPWRNHQQLSMSFIRNQTRRTRRKHRPSRRSPCPLPPP